MMEKMRMLLTWIQVTCDLFKGCGDKMSTLRGLIFIRGQLTFCSNCYNGIIQCSPVYSVKLYSFILFIIIF